MLKKIILFNLANQIKSIRFQVSLILISVIFIFSSIFHYKAYVLEINQYFSKQNDILNNQTKNTNKSATILATEFTDFITKPRMNSFISDCSESSFPNLFVYNAFCVKKFRIDKNIINPYIKISFKIHWVFIITYILSFIVLLLSYDSISSEKEDKTLSLCLSNSISRGLFILGKFIGIIISVSIILLIGIIAALVTLIALDSTLINNAIILEIFNFYIITVLYIATLSAFGILFSILSYNSNISLLYCLAFWIFITIIVPNSTLFVSNNFFQIDTLESVTNEIKQSQAEIYKNAPKGSGASRSNDLFYPNHKLRAELQTKLLSAEMKIRNDYYNNMFKQYEKTRNVALISPMCQYEYMIEILLGGGYVRFRKNWNDLHNFQNQFLIFFKNFDAKDNESPHWYNPLEPYSTTKQPVNIESVPKFKEKQLPFNVRLNMLKKYFIIIILTFGILLLIKFTIFSRYDIR